MLTTIKKNFNFHYPTPSTQTSEGVEASYNLGSTTHKLNVTLLKYLRKDKRVNVVRFSRNLQNSSLQLNHSPLSTLYPEGSLYEEFIFFRTIWFFQEFYAWNSKEFLIFQVCKIFVFQVWKIVVLKFHFINCFNFKCIWWIFIFSRQIPNCHLWFPYNLFKKYYLLLFCSYYFISFRLFAFSHNINLNWHRLFN